MAENSSDRFARAAGRAARAFRENQANDRAARPQRPSPAAGSSGDGGGLREKAARAAAQAADRAEPLRERVGQAAGEASRAYKEGQARDEARLKAAKEELAEQDEARRAAVRDARERELADRDRAEADAGLVHPLLRLARIWWGGVALLVLGLAAAFAYYGFRARQVGGEVIDPLTGLPSVGPLGGATGQFTLSGALVVLALFTLWGWIGLLRRRRSGISTLTTIAVLLLIPAFVRPNVMFIVLGLVMLIGGVLLWLPAVRQRVRR